VVLGSQGWVPNAMAPKRKGAAAPAPTDAEYKRLRYIRSILLSATEEQRRAAAEAAGMYPDHAHERMVEQFMANGRCPDGPHNVKPRLWTPEVLEQAVQLLVQSTERFTTQELLQALADAHAIDNAPHDADQFLRALREHLGEKQWTLIASCHNTLSYLSEKDKKDRRDWCAALNLRFMADGDEKLRLEHCVFLDETAMLDVPHPKGERLSAVNQSTRLHQR
jgi:hypothetical protein